MVSVEGIVSVFSDASFSNDIGLKSGPMEEGTNIETTGAVTGKYPLKGGSLSAREIRGADIHLVGSLDAAMGITGSTIRTQAALRALKKLSDDRKKNELETATLPREITRLEAEVEELEKNREAILDWAENLQYRCVLDVSGKLTAGTLVSSPNASLEIETGLISVTISEEPSKNPKKAPGFLKIEPLNELKRTWS